MLQMFRLNIHFSSHLFIVINGDISHQNINIKAQKEMSTHTHTPEQAPIYGDDTHPLIYRRDTASERVWQHAPLTYVTITERHTTNTPSQRMDDVLVHQYVRHTLWCTFYLASRHLRLKDSTFCRHFHLPFSLYLLLSVRFISHSMCIYLYFPFPFSICFFFQLSPFKEQLGKMKIMKNGTDFYINKTQAIATTKIKTTENKTQ